MTALRPIASILIAVVAAIFLISVAAQGQTPQANRPAAAPSSTDEMLSAQQLDALLAPIALYPDSLLSLVLMASTYPLEVVQADRWAKENEKLRESPIGTALKTAVDKKPWDDSVKSLVAAPDVLATMSSKLEWTTKLGNAVLAQQPDVMDAVQRLRARAESNGKLDSTAEQHVNRTPSSAGSGTQAPGGSATQGSGGGTIAITQTDPDMLYVPYYDPAVAYGDWPYSDYPPYYFGYPSYIGAGLAFGTGWALGHWSSNDRYWGGGINWNNNNINVDRPRVNPLAGNNWQHSPEHRGGVGYANSAVQQRFGDPRAAARNGLDGRGRDGNQVLNPSTIGAAAAGAGLGAALGSKTGQRPNAGQRPSNRPSAGQRPSQRPATAQRPSQKPKAAQRPSQRPSTAQRPSQRPSTAQRPSQRNAVANRGSGPARGQANLAARGGGPRTSGMGGGGIRAGGGGGMRAGGGGGFRGGGGGRGGGGRRSDIALKHDIHLLGHLQNGLGYYRFSYHGSNRAFVGVMAQEVETISPAAVTRGSDGYLRVDYDKLGIPFTTYERWIANGAHVPAGSP